MSRFTAVDLSQLPAPSIVETVSFEAVLSDLVADLVARDPSFTALLESDPAIKLLEVAAYRETLLRQRINDAARAVMLAYAGGADLDHLASLFGVQRAAGEEDSRLRLRVQAALEGFSTAGPGGAYAFHALSASPFVKDVGVVSPAPGTVRVSILSTAGDGTAREREIIDKSPATFTGAVAVLDGREIDQLSVSMGGQLLEQGVDYFFDASSSTLTRTPAGRIPAGATVQADFERAAELGLVRRILDHEDVRPLTDTVIVQSAEVVAYSVSATLHAYPGPSSGLVLAAARAALEAYVGDRHRMGERVAISGLYGALHVEGVERVEIASPLADIVATPEQAPYCSGIALTLEAV